MTERHVSAGPEETLEIGRKLGKKLKDGDIVALCGDLGAGKTVFVKGIAAGLEIREDEVTSPTFTLHKEYDGRLKLHHFDLYRIESEEELVNTGFYDILGDGICVIEWAGKAALSTCINVLIERMGTEDFDNRTITIERFEESNEDTGR